MKACVLEDVGKLVYREVPTPDPKHGEVLLKIKACGICSSDIDRVFKTGTYHFPTIPGHEFSGEIVALGEGVDKSLLHKRATVFPLLPCFSCHSCEIEEYARCENYSYFGSRCDGAYAEYLAVPTWNLAIIPDGLSYEAAAMCEPAAVALHTINAAHIRPGDTVAVVGNGTIGVLAALWARIQGAGQVIIIGRGKEKLKYAAQLGFTNIVDTAEEDPMSAVLDYTHGKGADISVEAVGTADAIETVISCVKKGGTAVLTGNPPGDITLSRNIYWKILRNELTLRGTWNSSFNKTRNEWKDSLQCMVDGKLPVEKLITHRFPLDKSEDAFTVLREKNEPSMKVMFIMSK